MTFKKEHNSSVGSIQIKQKLKNVSSLEQKYTVPCQNTLQSWSPTTDVDQIYNETKAGEDGDFIFYKPKSESCNNIDLLSLIYKMLLTVTL